MRTIDDELIRLGATLRAAADEREGQEDAIWLGPSIPRKRSRLIWAVAATLGTLLALGTPAVLNLLSNLPSDPAASTAPSMPPASTVPTPALPDDMIWYALASTDWELAFVDTDRGDGSVLMRYTSERQEALHPDRMILIFSTHQRGAMEFDGLLDGGPEIEGRVDGFGNPWGTPVDRIIPIGEREVRVVSFTDYAHIALWVEGDMGLALTTERSDIGQLVDLVESVTRVTQEEWELARSQ